MNIHGGGRSGIFTLCFTNGWTNTEVTEITGSPYDLKATIIVVMAILSYRVFV